MLAGAPQDRMRTNNQDATQVPIALFGHRPELSSRSLEQPRRAEAIAWEFSECSGHVFKRGAAIPCPMLARFGKLSRYSCGDL
jgi:hypothetical protein